MSNPATTALTAVTAGVLQVTDTRTGAVTWLGATQANQSSACAVTLCGGDHRLSFSLHITLVDAPDVASGVLGCAKFDLVLTGSPGADLGDTMVGLTYETLAGGSAKRVHIYPWAGNSVRLSADPLHYVGVPAVLAYTQSALAMELWGLDPHTDYLNPTTYTGNVGAHFDASTGMPTTFSFRGLAAGVQQSHSLQLILYQPSTPPTSKTRLRDLLSRPRTAGAEMRRDTLDGVTELVRAWRGINGYAVKPLHVRTPEEGLREYLAGRRSSEFWVEGAGYQLVAESWTPFIYVPNSVQSGYFDYLLFTLSNDTLWRDRAFQQLNFSTRAQYLNEPSRHHGTLYTEYMTNTRTFTNYDWNHGGWKPDMVSHYVRYMLLAIELIDQFEGPGSAPAAWRQSAVLAAQWVHRMHAAQADGGLPQYIDSDLDVASASVSSGRTMNAFFDVIRLVGDSPQYNFTHMQHRMEAFLKAQVESKFWFTGAHPDLYPDTFEQDSMWSVAEYWLSRHDRATDSAEQRECLRRAEAVAATAFLAGAPKDLSWVSNPTQTANCEQQAYAQYVVYSYDNRRYTTLRRLAEVTGDALYSQLAERNLQMNLFTQILAGPTQRGTFTEAIADPWLDRLNGFNWAGARYMDSMSLDLFLQLVLLGLRLPEW